MTVYFVGATISGFVKIGKADNVEQRVAALQTSCPEPLVLLATAPGGLAEESAFHRRHFEAKQRGEWYRPTALLLADIERAAGGPLPLFGYPDPRAERAARVMGEAQHALENDADFEMLVNAVGDLASRDLLRRHVFERRQALERVAAIALAMANDLDEDVRDFDHPRLRQAS